MKEIINLRRGRGRERYANSSEIYQISLTVK